PASDPVSLAISPDGQNVVFEGTTEGRSQLWMRSLELGTPPRPLKGTDSAHYPFWSPDGRSLGFFADGRLKTIEIDSASVKELANAVNGAGGTWNNDNVILFVPN